jgi:membrane associated rhomboid family serine protease
MPPELSYATHEPVAWVTITLVIITCLSSIAGFRDRSFEQRFIFCPENILRDKQGYRLITAAFLHANWGHLALNMFSLYAFGQLIELNYGIAPLLGIYFASIIGGNLLSLFLHRHHVYQAYGASGGVCGIIYAYIFLFPGRGILVFMIPFAVPSWLYAIGYLLLSFYGIKKAADNIGHDAHVGGAIIGLLTTTAIYPQIVQQSPKLYAAVMLLSVSMFLYLLKNPMFLPLTSFASERPRLRRATPPPKRTEKPQDINAILDKISKSGMQSLTKAEHEALLKASKKGRREENGR